MRIKVISDAHSNLPSLKEAVQSDDNEDYRIYCGDILGLMGYPSETLEYIRENFDCIVKGNHDVAIIEHGKGHVGSRKLSRFERDYVHDLLDEEQKEYIQNLDSMTECNFEGIDILVAHARPYEGKSDGLKVRHSARRIGRHLVASNGVMPPEMSEIAHDLPEYDLIGLGHTHEQSFHASEGATVVNGGSVGQHFRTENSYCVVDMNDNHPDVELYSVGPYRLEISERLRDVDAPDSFIQDMAP